MATHEREEQLFHSCLELPPAEQSPYLARACHGDAQLQTRVEQLVAAHRRAEKATLNPLRDILGPIPGQDELDTAGEERLPAGRAGDTVGPYRLVRLLAEGGMGSVWLAERNDQIVNRPIALKLPRSAWPRAGLAARMAREREILAAFSHANIARLYDAGFTSEGQPYLALEYVEGRRIDEHCRDKGLDLKARRGLFLQVANAVAHAHAKLIVHRDLKPANILVTEDGQVRLLDFGIAKLLEEGPGRNGELTQLTGRAFTPDYASPEQVAGEPVSVASDVYSLGVVLYELLTQTPPYRIERDSRAALEEAILETDPAKPSDAAADRPLRRALRGDLDTIVLKALKKRPEDRYPTVNAFADDVERYRQGRPVLAQPDRALYRARRFVGRNKLAVGAAAAIVLALIVGATVAVWQARVALAEKERAEEVKDFIASIFRDANPFAEQGQALSATDLLKQAKDRIDRLSATRPELRVELLNLVGASLMGIGDTEAAEGVALQAVKEAGQALTPDHPQAIQARLLMTDVHRYRGRTREMRRELDALLPVVRRRAETDPEDLVRTLENRAHMAFDDGDAREAIDAAQEAFDLAILRLGERHRTTLSVAAILAESLNHPGNRSRADVLPATERAMRLAVRAHPDQPRHPQVIDMRNIYGRALADAGQTRRGVLEMSRALRDASEVFGESSRMAGYIAAGLAPAQRWLGDVKGALENGDRSLAILEKHTQRESFTYAQSLTNRGVTWLAARRGNEALRDLSAAKETFGRIFGRSHWDTLNAQFNGAIALAYLGRFEQAREELRPLRARSVEIRNPMWAAYVLGTVERLAGEYAAALRAHEECLGLIADDSRAGWNRARALAESGLDQLELGNQEQAALRLERARALFAELETVMHPARVEVLVGLGRVRLRQGRPDEALPLLQEADAFWRDFDPENRWSGEAAWWLGRCYAALGRSADARPVLRRARSILARSPIPGDARLAGSSP
jgi:serine/threonine-protein kinase